MTIIDFLSDTSEIEIILEELVSEDQANIEWEEGKEKRIAKVGRRVYDRVKFNRDMQGRKMR